MGKNVSQDPLNEIIESHLYQASTEGDMSANTVDRILQDYLQHLKSQGVHIPHPVKGLFMEDIREEIRELIIKKTYGKVILDDISPATQASKPLKSARKPA